MAHKGQNAENDHARIERENRSVRKNFCFTQSFVTDCQKAADSDGVSLTQWLINAALGKLRSEK